MDSMPKMANQIMIAGTLSGVCEALTYAKAKGLNLDTVLKSVATGAAGSKQLDTFLDRRFWQETMRRIFPETFC